MATLFAIAAASFAAPSARAECGLARAVMSPPSGRVLPTSPVLYAQYHTYFDLELEVTLDGAPVPYRAEVVSRYGRGATYRIEVDARGAGVLEIANEQSWESLVWRYRVDPDADPPTAESVEFQAWARSESFICDPSESIVFDPGVDADAVRVEVAPSLDAWDARSSVVVPSPDGAIEVGHVMCKWDAIAPDELERFFVRFTALYADGSERVVNEAPMYVERAWLPDYSGRDANVRRSDAVTLEPTRLEHRSPASARRTWGLFGLIAVLLAALVLALRRAVVPARTGQP